MGIATYPSISSPVKSIQRGSASASGNITITAVDTAKTMVNSFSTSSSGTVAASGTINAANGNDAAGTINFSGLYLSSSPTYQFGNSTQVVIPATRYSTATTNPATQITLWSANKPSTAITLNSTNITGGTNNLIAGVNGVYLSNSTTLVATGPCRYEVIEYY